MPGTFEFAEVSYTLTDLVVAKYNITLNIYETPIALASGQLLEITHEHDTDQLVGYGVTTRLLSVGRTCKIKLGAGGLDSNAMQAICGMTNDSSGSAPNRVRRRRAIAGGAGLPYFGVIGVAATDDGGSKLVGLQACKLDMFPTYTADGKENKFNVSEVEGTAIPIAISGTTYFETARDLETAGSYATPTTAAQFLAFFTD